MNLDFLPLKSYVNIIEGNALRIDWETVVPKRELNYIMGNPPFVGGMYMSPEQKKDIRHALFGSRRAQIGILNFQEFGIGDSRRSHVHQPAQKPPLFVRALRYAPAAICRIFIE